MTNPPTGDQYSTDEAIPAPDTDGPTLRDELLDIQAPQPSDDGEAARLAEAEQAKQAEIDQAKQSLQEFRDYLKQSSGMAAQALASDNELAYTINPDTQECEITRLDGEPIDLNISNSDLTGSLPLPAQLMVANLWCNYNQLTALPDELPASLTVLYCGNNQLTALQAPASLTVLECGNNPLIALSELPASLMTLDCRNNQLTSLPELPASLRGLWCQNNQLKTLPELPARLSLLDCHDNQLNRATRATLQRLKDRGATVIA